jgi:hypothetical protein
VTVRLHIERLVVEGFDLSGAGADKVRAALEAELSAQILEAAGEPWTGLAAPVLRFELAELPGGASPEQLGCQAGAALCAGLRR